MAARSRADPGDQAGVGARLARPQRRLPGGEKGIAWFGVRGIGSLYYAAIAVGAGVLSGRREADRGRRSPAWAPRSSSTRHRDALEQALAAPGGSRPGATPRCRGARTGGSGRPAPRRQSRAPGRPGGGQQRSGGRRQGDTVGAQDQDRRRPRASGRSAAGRRRRRRSAARPSRESRRRRRALEHEPVADTWAPVANMTRAMIRLRLPSPRITASPAQNPSRRPLASPSARSRSRWRCRGRSPPTTAARAGRSGERADRGQGGLDHDDRHLGRDQGRDLGLASGRSGATPRSPPPCRSGC